MLEFILNDMPPSLNHLYATVETKGGSRRVLSSAGNDWKKAAAWEIALKAKEQGWSIEKKTPFTVEALFLSPDVLRWDVDGKAKILIDAICEAFGIDDRYLMHLELSKARSGLTRVEVKVVSHELVLTGRGGG